MFDKLHVDPKEMPCDSGMSFGWHRHTCTECTFEWAHDGALMNAGNSVEAHECPQCHAMQWWCADVVDGVRPVCEGGMFERDGEVEGEDLLEWLFGEDEEA